MTGCDILKQYLCRKLAKILRMVFAENCLSENGCLRFCRNVAQLFSFLFPAMLQRPLFVHITISELKVPRQSQSVSKLNQLLTLEITGDVSCTFFGSWLVPHWYPRWSFVVQYRDATGCGPTVSTVSLCMFRSPLFCFPGRAA